MDPKTLRYSKTHEWVALENDTATIGITDFAVHLLSDLVFAELPAVGRKLKQGEPFGDANVGPDHTSGAAVTANSPYWTGPPPSSRA